MEPIHYAEEDSIAIVTIDRQSRMNALDPEAMRRFRETLEMFEASANARVAIVTGAGARAFCAGADIHQTMGELEFCKDFFDRSWREDNALYIRNIALPRLPLSKPLIAAVNGVAAGGGMELALNCDICIAASNARFGLTEVRIGSIPAVGGIQRLMRSLPRAFAMKLLLTGELIGAQEALQWGLVVEVVPPDALLPRARELATQIAANAPLAVRAVRYLAEKAFSLSLDDALDIEELVWGHIYATRDRREGRLAFSEKRPPAFRGE